MTGRTPADAARPYMQALHLALSAVTLAIPIRSRRQDDLHRYDITVSEQPVRLQSDQRLALEVRQQYRTVQVSGPPGGWSIETIAYEYQLLDVEARELLGFHLHAEGRSAVTFPHLHIGRGFENAGNLMAKAHVPTGVVTLPDVLRMAIADLGVRPRRGDWAATLEAAHGRLSTR